MRPWRPAGLSALWPHSVASWCSPQGDVLTTKYQVDLGDGFKATYVNLTLTEEPIRHRYESPGVYRVSVRAENTAGRDEALLFVQVNCKSAAPPRPRGAPWARENLVLEKCRESLRPAPGPQSSGRQARGQGDRQAGLKSTPLVPS